MKKILTHLFGLFFFVSAFAATTMYIGTEQKYIFTAENLAQTIPEFIENEKKQEKMAETYTRVMNQETGAVSVANLFEVCRAGGFNTYRQTGYEQCRGFILKLLENAEQEVEEGFLDGFCPAAYDENGKQQNGLRSIGDQTRIGDFCSSTNIAGGEVVFRKGYNCTCAAYACNPGFQSEKGACVTEYKDANGDCLRKEYTNMTNITTAEEALQFCESQAIKGCKVRNAIRSFGGVKGRIVCNATRDEVDNAKARMLDQQDKQIANLQYYDVCRKYKGRTGKKEYCIDKLFSGLDVGLNEAAGLAQLYATEKNGHTIYCDPSHNKRTINDYFNCSTLDKSVYYTFKFDDTVETNDAKKFRNTVRGIALIYGLPEKANNTIHGACTTKLQNAAKRFGMKAQTSNNSCVFDYGTKTDNKNIDSALHTIEGIDNYVFYHEVQLRGSTRLRDNLKQYIKDQGFVITAFDCDNSYGRIKKRFIEGDDETLTCRLSGTRNGVRYTNQPIDFVFDDLSESRKTTREAGESGVACIISGGAYANKNCHGLDQNQCTQVNAKLKAENPKSSGTKWQNGQCVLIDVKEQNRLENGIQIGLTVIALADCATVIIGNAQGVMGCTLAVVEITSLATELTTGAAMQQRADDFIKIAVACNNRSCAKNTLKTMAGKALTVQDALKSASTAHQIDVQLARLVEYLEPEDLQSEVSANDWDDIVRQLGGDPNDTAGRALKIANKIGFIGQFASLGASAFRLTGKAIAKVAAKSATKTAASGTKALAVVGEHADDAAKAADNAADAARGASGGAEVAGNADDAARGASSSTSAAGKAQDIIYDAAYFSRNTSGSDDVFKGADDLVQVNRQDMPAATIRDLMRKAKQYGFECTDCGGDILKFSKSADSASDAARSANNASDAARGASKTDDVSDATKGASDAKNPSKSADDAGHSPVGNPVKSKSQKIAEARQRGDLGYHGTDADIAMDDMIRSSANSSDQLGSVGYGIAKDYDAAEKYAAKRLVERQNVGKNIKFYRENKVLIIESSEPLNLSNKTGYVYTTAKDSLVKWETLRNGYVGAFDAAQMPHSVEVLDKIAFNLDDLIRQGKVKIIEPKAANASSGVKAAPKSAASTASKSSRAANATADAARTANNASDAVRQGSINISQADEDLIRDAIIKKQSKKLSRTEHIKAIRTMDKYFDAGAAENFARQMRKDLVDAFVQNPRPEIITDGQAFAEFIIEKLGPKYGIPQGTIRVQIAPVRVGYAQYVDHVLYLNSNLAEITSEQLINLVTHEFVHAIDDLAPEYGVIGKKLNAYGDLSGLYVGPGQLMDGAQDMYKLIPTERAAHKVGDIVSGATDYGRKIGDNSIRYELINVLSQ